MIKFVKRLILFLLLVIVALIVVSMIVLDSIKYQVTSDDLPQDVYETSGDLLDYAKVQIAGLVLADEDDRYTMMEEIINLIILDSIQKNINTSYDPLGDCVTDACQYIYKDSPFYIDYAYAYLNDNNQIVIVLSGGSDKYITASTAIFMVFDVEFDLDILDPGVVLTLDSYSFGEKEMSMKILNFTFDKIDKDNIEDSMTFGDLDLDNYTFTISISDALLT